MTRARRWLDDVTGALGPGAHALDATAARAVLADLEARHGEPQRHYHTIVHVDAVLAHLDELLAAEPVDPADDVPATAVPIGPAVRLAAWFHDAIYDPTSPGNEAASADLASRELGALGIAPEVIAEVDRLIRMTAGHFVEPGDRTAALLADADLSILGAPAAVYDGYAEQIRSEYRHVPADAWRVGRADVLASFLERARLFTTRTGRERWERPARANLERERQSLLDPNR